MISAVLDEDTGELMEYRGLMKNPKYRKLYAKLYTKELGRLAQGMPGQVEETNTIFFIPKKDVSLDCWRGCIPWRSLLGGHLARGACIHCGP